MLGEFEQIAQIMAPLAADAKGAFALTDDAAVFSCPPGHEIVVTTDTLIADVHFFANDPAEDIGRKLLGVNLSDLAAMGAKPLHYTLNASYPASISMEWIKSFADGLREMQDTFGIILLGGDTTRTPGPLTLSLSAFGHLPQGEVLRRTTSQPGDLICVSGTIGDSALGLKVAEEKLTDESGFLLQRYRQPQPRVELGQALVGLATACLDISDGLLGDLQHMKAGADINIPEIPLSKPAEELILKDSSLINAVLGGGDDYELLFTVAPSNRNRLSEISRQTDTKISIIGRITDRSGVTLLDQNGQEVSITAMGYRHF